MLSDEERARFERLMAVEVGSGVAAAEALARDEPGCLDCGAEFDQGERCMCSDPAQGPA